MKMLDRKGDDEGGSYAGASRKSSATATGAPQTEDEEEVPF